MTDPHFIKYAGHAVDEKDIQAVAEALRADFISQGPKIDEFEEKLAALAGAKFCTVVSSGTAALHLAVKALDLPDNRRGITSPVTFFATANAMVYNRLRPDFADIDEKTYCLSPAEVNGRIDENTGLVIPVHFAGQPADMKALWSLAQEKGLYVIEDAAHALGGQYADGRPIGNCFYSHMTCFSFQPLKTITTGEGGAITTNNREIHEKLRRLRNHGIVRKRSEFGIESGMEIGPWYHEIRELGFNYRLTDFQAALGINQLGRMEAFIRRRGEIVDAYNRAFADLAWLTCPYVHPGVSSAYHLYVVQIDFKVLGKSRSQVMDELKNNGVGTQVHYIPVHLQPFYRKRYSFKPGDFPRAEDYYSRCLSLPLHVRMTHSDVEQVISSVALL